MVGSLRNQFSLDVSKQMICAQFYEVDYATALGVKYVDPVVPRNEGGDKTVMCYNSRNFPSMYYHVSGV